MLVRVNRPALQATRAAFTLLEVLVVVAILVILAAVAGVYVFGYLEDAKMDTAGQQILQLENAAKNYMAKNGGTPPDSLMVLVAPVNGGLPLIEGGQNALIDPWNKPYQYDPSNVDQYGAPDPMVMTTGPQGQPILSPKRKAGK